MQALIPVKEAARFKLLERPAALPLSTATAHLFVGVNAN